MNCRDTERLWNERLDARIALCPDLDAALDAHAATCPACAQVAARYQTLLKALRMWDLVPIASPEFVDRLRNLPTDRPDVIPFSRPHLIPRLAWLSAAAAVFVAVVIGWRIGRVADKPGIEPQVVQSAPRSISDALADATSATWELARETSAPAGRVGRVVLASTTLPNADSPLSLRVPAAPTTEILQSVGVRVEAGVRPLSGSARQAFGFLIRTATGDTREVPAHAPTRGT